MPIEVDEKSLAHSDNRDRRSSTDSKYSVNTLRGMVPIELATSIKAVCQRKLGACRNLASYLVHEGCL